ncbi:MAG: hypothetical protein ACRCZY_08965 [Phocaeicola sp.]
MSIKFDFYAIPNPEDATQEITHVRSVMNPSLLPNEIIAQMEKGRTITKSDIKAVLTALACVMKSELLAGRSFYLEEIGLFGLSLKANPEREGEIEKIRSSQIAINTVNFRVEKSFLTELREEALFKMPLHKKHSPKMTHQKLIHLLANYFQEHEELTRKKFEEITCFTRITALRRLKSLEEAGIIVNVGNRQQGRFRWVERVAKRKMEQRI